MANFWLDICRGIFSAIDGIIYGIVSLIYNAFIMISQVSILSNTTIENFASRIYLIIGIVMLFKTAFSLIQMFANPESAKGDKGVGKLVQKIIVMLILLVSIPTIFQIGYDIQRIVLEKNVLGNLVLGGSSNTDATGAYYRNAGENIALNVFKGFLYPSDKNDEESVQAWNSLTSVGNALDKKMPTESKNGLYKYNYNFFISTLAGGLTAWIIGIFCFDVAVRTVKLTFLQIIAPVPIIASIDPKGKKTFDNWVQNCIKTYLDVFIRLLAIYFVIFIIVEMTQNGLFTFYRPGTGEQLVGNEMNFFVGAMVIIGLLIFAKQVPKLLEDLLGIKLGGFTLNPFKKLEKAAGLGGIARAGNSLMGAGASIAKNAPRLLGGRALDRLRGKDVATGFETRKDAMLAEARSRMHNRSEKYSGETYSGILNKEKEELSRNKTKGQKEIAERAKMLTDGKIYFEGSTDAKVRAYAQALANGLEDKEAKAFASSAANRAVFKNEAFVKTLEKMDSEKGKMYELKNTAQMAESNYSAALATNNEEQIRVAKEALEKANKDSGTAEKRYEFAKQEHESNRKIYASDAKIQDAKDVYEKTEKQEDLTRYEEELNERYMPKTTTVIKSDSSSSSGQTGPAAKSIKTGGTTPSGIILDSSDSAIKSARRDNPNWNK